MRGQGTIASVQCYTRFVAKSVPRRTRKFGVYFIQITMADFVIADVTDSMLDGIISGFPNTYATKVGKTSDAMYKAYGFVSIAVLFVGVVEFAQCRPKWISHSAP